MKKYVLLLDILLFWSGMSRRKICFEKLLLHRLCNSLRWERECSDLLGFWKAGRRVRSYSGPEVKIRGWEGDGEMKKPQPGDGWGLVVQMEGFKLILSSLVCRSLLCRAF